MSVESLSVEGCIYRNEISILILIWCNYLGIIILKETIIERNDRNA
jgi:hypothetical protein